jgi:hypothetical protein
MPGWNINQKSKILEDNENVLFVTKNFLISCLHKPILKQEIISKMRRPTNFPPEERILSLHH